MPIYEFQCHGCGLQFEAYLIRSKRGSFPCPNCGEEGKPMIPTDVSGTFKKEVSGPGPQNTGIHDFDTHIDRVIGQHSEQGYEIIGERVTEKKKVMATEGVGGEMLSRNTDGSYRAMTPEEKAAHDRSQDMHGAAMNLRAKKRRTRRSR